MYMYMSMKNQRSIETYILWSLAIGHTPHNKRDESIYQHYPNTIAV